VEVRASRIIDELEKNKVVIVAGYQGVSRSKEVTTLGRGGSDTTAIALAAALDARLCEVYTDVDGVYTADPRIVDGARKHDRLSYEEMLSLSATGGIVLKKEAMEYAKKHSIQLVIKSSFSENTGTVVGAWENQCKDNVVGITHECDLIALLIHGEKTQDRTLDLIKDLTEEGIEVKDFVLDCSDEDTIARHLFLVISVPTEYEVTHVEHAVASMLGGFDYKLIRCGSVSIVTGTNAHLSSLYVRILKVLRENSVHVYGLKKEFAAVTAYVEETMVKTVSNLLHEEFVTD
jgi:aspartate kinase